MEVKKMMIMSKIFALMFISLFLVGVVNASESSDIINYLNQTGGIPIKVTTTAVTDWTQYLTSLLLGSFFIFFFFGQILIEGTRSIVTKLYFHTLKRKTGRHVLFIKHTRQDMFGGSMIDQSTINDIAEALNKFEGKPFDLILHTPGGEIFSAMYISRMLKQYQGNIRTIIPCYAMSGGTLLALSTDEIFMAPTACLGPVDPQLGSLFKFGSAKSWDKILKYKGKRAEDSSLSFAFMGKQYTKSIRTHLKNTIGFGLDEKQKNRFANFLTSGDVEHAFSLTPADLSKFGLRVEKINDPHFLGKMIEFISKSGKEGVTYV